MSVARDAPPYRRLGALMLVAIAALGAALFLQFRGDFTASSTVTLVSDRAGLVVERGAKVTFNGVEIGRVAQIVPDPAGARLTLDVDPDLMAVIPANAGPRSGRRRCSATSTSR